MVVSFIRVWVLVVSSYSVLPLRTGIPRLAIKLTYSLEGTPGPEVTQTWSRF